MSELQIFTNNGYEIRSMIIDGEPMFIAEDVAIALGLKDGKSALRSISKQKKGVVSKHPLLTEGGEQQVNYLTEQGLYMMIMQSRKPSAIDFQLWVTGEVLPSIRKTGSYKIETRTPLQIIEETLEFARKEIIVEKVKRKEIEHFVDTTMSGEGLITFEHATKLLHDRYETNIGRNTLMSILRDNQVLQQNNRPYQRYMNWFKVIKKVTDSGNYDVTLVYEDKLRYINNYIR